MADKSTARPLCTLGDRLRKSIKYLQISFLFVSIISTIAFIMWGAEMKTLHLQGIDLGTYVSYSVILNFIFIFVQGMIQLQYLNTVFFVFYIFTPFLSFLITFFIVLLFILVLDISNTNYMIFFHSIIFPLCTIFITHKIDVKFDKSYDEYQNRKWEKYKGT